MADVTLPSLGESVTEGIIIRWFKQVGERVERDEVLYEISTDKVDSEMPSPESGTLERIVVAEGDTVAVGGVVAVIGASTPGSVETPASPSAPTESHAVSAVVASAPVPSPVSRVEGLVLSPVVRRVLADGNIDVRSVRGSGVGGTITRRDAEAAVAKGPSGEQAVALTSVQRRMAEHLSAAAQSTPQGFVAVEIDARIIDLVDALGGQTRDGIEISDEALVALAAIRAITEFPSLNATFAVTEVVQHYAVNIGFVRDVTSDGIAVPVIHAASQLSLAALVRCLADLDERLANNLLVTEDLMGGTFTVHAAPSANTVLVQPLLLPGQTAILSMGSARHAPIVERIDGVRSIVAGRRMTLGLAFDYRVLDAVVAAKFLERVGEILQTINLDTER